MSLFNVKQKEISTRKLYTGVIPYSVVAVNPSKEELMELLGTENVNDPNYVTEDKTRIDFWVKNDELNILTKLAIFLEPKERVSKNGNTLFINDKNQTTWAESVDAIANKPNMSWFDLVKVRKCGVGEDILYNFVVTLINADTSEGGIVLETYDKILTGDVSELRKLVNHYSDRQIKLLTGIKDGRYRLYSKYFIKNEIRSTKGLMTALENMGFDAHYTLEGPVVYDDVVKPKETTSETTGTRSLF